MDQLWSAPENMAMYIIPFKSNFVVSTFLGVAIPALHCVVCFKGCDFVWSKDLFSHLKHFRKYGQRKRCFALLKLHSNGVILFWIIWKVELVCLYIVLLNTCTWTFGDLSISRCFCFSFSQAVEFVHKFVSVISLFSCIIEVA